jgi:hypothetical protein
MLARLSFVLLLVAGLRGCVTYEYEHEIWLRVDGSGTVNVTGRPALWTAFKQLGSPQDPDGTVTIERARDLFERSGLRVRRVTITQRDGHAYLFVSAAFDDVNRLGQTPAFPDLRMSLKPTGDRLQLEGNWQRPSGAPAFAPSDREGLMAVRLHLPSKVFSHQNAVDGVERGNILGWRQDVVRALDGERLEFGALMDRRSILGATVMLFASAIALALVLLGLAVYLVFRRGRRQRQAAVSDGMAPGP